MVFFVRFFGPAETGQADSIVGDVVLDRVVEIIAPVVFAELEREGVV